MTDGQEAPATEGAKDTLEAGTRKSGEGESKSSPLERIKLALRSELHQHTFRVAAFVLVGSIIVSCAFWFYHDLDAKDTTFLALAIWGAIIGVLAIADAKVDSNETAKRLDDVSDKSGESVELLKEQKQLSEERIAPERARPDSRALVGRGDTMRKLRGQLVVQHPQPVVLWGMSGIGKSQLAANVMDDLTYPGGPFGRGWLWTHLGPEPERAPLLLEWLRAIDPQVAKKYGPASHEAELTSAISTAIHKRERHMPPTLVVIDDVWKWEDAKPFVDAVLAQNLPILLTTNDLKEAKGAIDGDPWPLEIEGLSDDESLELVRRKLEERGVETKIADATQQFILKIVRGVPFFLIQVGEFGADHGFDDLGQIWQSFDEKLRQTGKAEPINAEQLFKMRLERLDNAERGRLLEAACALLPSFTAREMALITGELKADTDDDNARKITKQVGVELDDLVECCFLEKTPDGYGFHRIARQATEEFFREHHEAKTDSEGARESGEGRPTSIEGYHRFGAAYWGQVLDPERDETQKMVSSYRLAEQRESPELQRAAENWLHHLQHLEDTAYARLAFNFIYFQYFWWWGNYIEYPFLESLVSEQRLKRGLWGSESEDKENERWVDEIVRFHQNYPVAHSGVFPVESNRTGTSEKWEKARTALIAIQKIDKLGDDPPPPEEVAWAPSRKHMHQHTHALIEVFLAHCDRYGGGTPEAVDEHYEKALKLFGLEECVGSKCSWNIPWVISEQADVAIDRARDNAAAAKFLTEALRKTREAARLVLEEDDLDYEVIASCCRARGDIAWRNGNYQEAVSWYDRAVLVAYAWQYDPRTDRYTRAFYGEMIAHLIKMVQDLPESEREARKKQYADFHRSYRERSSQRDADWQVENLTYFEPLPASSEDESQIPEKVMEALGKARQEIKKDVAIGVT